MPTPGRVLILAPMASELKPLVRLIGARRADIGGVRLYRGRVGAVEVALTRIGVGPAAARRATRRALGAAPVEHVVVAGIAGGLHPDLRVGRAVIPETVLDLASGAGFPTAPLGAVARSGTVGVADRLITDAGRLADLLERGILALEMESSGVAAACTEAGLPLTVIRVISDRPDERLADDAVLGLLRPDGTADLPAALRLVASRPGRIPGLVRLGRDSSMAAGRAAQITVDALRAMG